MKKMLSFLLFTVTAIAHGSIYKDVLNEFIVEHANELADAFSKEQNGITTEFFLEVLGTVISKTLLEKESADRENMGIRSPFRPASRNTPLPSWDRKLVEVGCFLATFRDEENKEALAQLLQKTVIARIKTHETTMKTGFVPIDSPRSAF